MAHRRMLDRSMSMNVDVRPPSTDSPTAKTATPSLFGRCKSFQYNIREVCGETENSWLSCENSPLIVDEVSPVHQFEDTDHHDELSITILKNTIRYTLLDNMENAGDIKTLLDIEGGKIEVSDLELLLQKSSHTEKNITFLWISFLKKYEMFEVMMKLGIDINFTLSDKGLTALQLSAFSGCVRCCIWLIEKGCDVNQISNSYTPLQSAILGNSTETTKLLLKHGAHISNTMVHSAVLANAVGCLNILLSQGVNVNHIDRSGMSPLHIVAERKMGQCMKMLLEYHTINVNLLEIRVMGSTALHYTSESGYLDGVAMLLDKGASVSARNKKGQIPLHLAARGQSIECVEALLKAGSDVNAKDRDNKTPLHAAVSKASLALDIVEMLIGWGTDINIKDLNGNTALHVAALNEHYQCVDALIMQGAQVGAKSKAGVTSLSIVCRKVPPSLSSIYNKLDSSITLQDPESSNQDVEMKLDFCYLLQHPYGSGVGLLKNLVDEGQEDLLEHPLSSALLNIRWKQIRRYYFCRILLNAMIVIFLSLYVMTVLAHNCYNSAHNISNTDVMRCNNNSLWGEYLTGHPFVMDFIWYILEALVLCEAVRKLLGIAGYVSFKHYFTKLRNIFEWFTIISVFMVSYIYDGQTYQWQNHIGAFSVLCGWTNLMVMIGQLPLFGTYVAMFIKVQAGFLKLLFAYVCLLVGFTICFCVIFPTSKSFKNPMTAFVQVIVMMTGDLDLEPIFDVLKDEDYPNGFISHFNTHVIYTLFLVFVSIMLMNLLVALAVHDIQGLHKTAGLSTLVRQTELISYLEVTSLQRYVGLTVINILKRIALVSPSFTQVVLYVKPLNPKEKRLPKELLQAAYDIARQQRKCKQNTLTSTVTHKYYSEENKHEADEVRQLKQLLLEQQHTLLEQQHTLFEQQQTLHTLAALVTNKNGAD